MDIGALLLLTPVKNPIDFAYIGLVIDNCTLRLYLQGRGCAMGQGYLFSRPVSSLQLACLLQEGKEAAKETFHADCPV
jgi:hypothetical protein